MIHFVRFHPAAMTDYRVQIRNLFLYTLSARRHAVSKTVAHNHALKASRVCL